MPLRFAAACLVLAACRPHRVVPRVEAASTLRDASGAAVATARFTAVGDGVLLRLDAASLPPGLHGIHVHENGRCEPPDFESAGGHLNPAEKAHGLLSAGGSHAGDMPNLEVRSDRSAHVRLRLPGATLGPGTNSLLRPGGTALVIHAEPDDQATDPSGSSGKRLACGVIVES